MHGKCFRTFVGLREASVEPNEALVGLRHFQTYKLNPLLAHSVNVIQIYLQSALPQTSDRSCENN